jgi:hypothetical protein
MMPPKGDFAIHPTAFFLQKYYAMLILKCAGNMNLPAIPIFLAFGTSMHAKEG